jgi:hypothetical protein
MTPLKTCRVPHCMGEAQDALDSIRDLGIDKKAPLTH